MWAPGRSTGLRKTSQMERGAARLLEARRRQREAWTFAYYERSVRRHLRPSDGGGSTVFTSRVACAGANGWGDMSR